MNKKIFAVILLNLFLIGSVYSETEPIMARCNDEGNIIVKLSNDSKSNSVLNTVKLTINASTVFSINRTIDIGNIAIGEQKDLVIPYKINNQSYSGAAEVKLKITASNSQYSPKQPEVRFNFFIDSTPPKIGLVSTKSNGNQASILTISTTATDSLTPISGATGTINGENLLFIAVDHGYDEKTEKIYASLSISQYPDGEILLIKMCV
jgi:hypothetical protein